VVIFNDDTLLISNAFAEMVAFLDAHPQYGAVGPKLLNRDGSFQLGPRGPATIWTLMWNEFKLDSFFPKSRVFGAFYMKYWDPNEPCEMVTGSGACMVVRREVFQQVGLLEDGIVMGPDDVEFSIRVRQAGWKLYYMANVSIIHYGEASKKRSQVESMIRMYKGWFWFLGHQYGWLHAHGYRPAAGLGALIRITGWLAIYIAKPAKRAHALERIRGRWGILRLSLSPSLKQIVIAGM
jgi:GT2 family glycosyltransferase